MLIYIICIIGSLIHIGICIRDKEYCCVWAWVIVIAISILSMLKIYQLT